MKIYHGSNMVVTHPAVRVPARALDFGVGFYTTSNYNQAARWARRKAALLGSGRPMVTIHDLD